MRGDIKSKRPIRTNIISTLDPSHKDVNLPNTAQLKVGELLIIQPLNGGKDTGIKDFVRSDDAELTTNAGLEFAYNFACVGVGNIPATGTQIKTLRRQSSNGSGRTTYPIIRVKALNPKGPTVPVPVVSASRVPP